MRYASVCSGVGTCALAWQPLGWETAWFSEISGFPCKVLGHRFPAVPNHGDMLGVLGHALRRLRGDPTDSYIDLDIDLLAGGCPCQAFSMAGSRLSLEDARGNLTLAFCQLVHAIDAGRAGGLPWVVYENVPGILSTADNAFGCFLAGLAGEDAPLLPPEGVGKRRWRTGGAGKRIFSWPDAGVVAGPRRTVAWRVLDAQHFGLPQRRRRVIVVSCPAETGFRAAEVLFEPAGVRGDPAPGRAAGEGAAAGAEGGAGRGGVAAFGGNDKRGAIPVVAALNANKGCHNPGDFEAGTLLVEGVVPLLEVTGRRSEPTDKRGGGIGEPGDPMFTLQAKHQHGVAVPVDLRNMTMGGTVTPPVMSGPKGEGPGVTPHVLERDVYQCQGSNVGPIGTLVCGDNVTNGVPFVTDVAPVDLVQVTSKTNCTPVKFGAPAHCIHGDTHPPAVVEAYRTNSKGEVSAQGDRTATLTTSTDRCTNIVRDGYRVRRLMPVECEELPGCPGAHARARDQEGKAGEGRTPVQGDRQRLGAERVLVAWRPRRVDQGRGALSIDAAARLQRRRRARKIGPWRSRGPHRARAGIRGPRAG